MKKIVASLFVLFALTPAFCQSFMHGVGLSIFLGTARGGDVTVGQGFTYSPRFNFVETDKLSVSVGIPLTLGITGSYSASYGSGGYSESNSLGLVVNAPVLINLNMGRGSTKENRQKFGYFVGAGFGFHHGDFLVTTLNSDVITESMNTFGPATNAGMRFGVGRKHKNIEVRFSFMKGISENRPNLFGIGSSFNF